MKTIVNIEGIVKLYLWLCSAEFLTEFVTGVVTHIITKIHLICLLSLILVHCGLFTLQELDVLWCKLNMIT